MENDLELKKLDNNDLDNLIQLQNKIIAGLHPDEQHFILHRTREDFAKALNSPNARRRPNPGTPRICLTI